MTNCSVSTCDDCIRRAKFSYIINHNENTHAKKCGYHTWWFGTQMESDQKERLNEKYLIGGP